MISNLVLPFRLFLSFFFFVKYINEVAQDRRNRVYAFILAFCHTTFCCSRVKKKQKNKWMQSRNHESFLNTVLNNPVNGNHKCIMYITEIKQLAQNSVSGLLRDMKVYACGSY